MRPIHIRKDNLLCSVYRFNCNSHLKPCSQKYPEITFDLMSGHSEAYSSWHIKLTMMQAQNSQLKSAFNAPKGFQLGFMLGSYSYISLFFFYIYRVNFERGRKWLMLIFYLIRDLLVTNSRLFILPPAFSLAPEKIAFLLPN
jgi:hypothetical protein